MVQPTAAGSRGFTLIEILIVLALIGILASIAVPVYTAHLVKTREAVLLEDLFQMRDAIDKYYSDKGVYPPSLDALVESKYIRSVPVDPFTGASDTWEEVLADNGSGVFDLHSGSDKVGRNGTNYYDW
jgi:general secretion pathway protein G